MLIIMIMNLTILTVFLVVFILIRIMVTAYLLTYISHGSKKSTLVVDFLDCYFDCVSTGCI